ncbi:MAG: Outer membrane protein assembly factor BamD [Candidatus Marinimicrobia bacterium]|nr:Outer membrane protein assembly factor BamD [Candidatus Neomarinimicrobiota bacterium]
MCNKLLAVVLVGGILGSAAQAIAQDTLATTPDSAQQSHSVDSSAVENKFKMYDLGIQVDPTEEEKEEASKQLEEMATQNAKTLAQQEKARAKTRIDSLMQAEKAAADSASIADAQDTSRKEIADTTEAPKMVAADTVRRTPVTTDSLVTLAELQGHLKALRMKYQQEISELRDRNLQLSRKIEYLQGEIRRMEETISSPESPEQPPKSLQAQTQPGQRKIPPKETHLEKEYLLGVRSYYASNFAGALGKFQRVVENAADKQLAANAQYWIGESYYQLGNFSQAIQEMDQYINEFQATKQRKDALVIMGLAHKRLGQLEQALHYFERVVKDYPESEYARIAKSEVKKLRYLTS